MRIIRKIKILKLLNPRSLASSMTLLFKASIWLKICMFSNFSSLLYLTNNGYFGVENEIPPILYYPLSPIQ